MFAPSKIAPRSIARPIMAGLWMPGHLISREKDKNNMPPTSFVPSPSLLCHLEHIPPCSCLLHLASLERSRSSSFDHTSLFASRHP